MKRTIINANINGRSLELSNQEKMLWPNEGITKADLIAYYRSIARWILPYLKDRPLTLERFPDGVEAESFFEKNAPRGAPPWVRTVTVPSESERHGATRFVICDDESTLVYLINLASITLHIWMSRAGSLDIPDFMLFDLDPDEACTLGTLGRIALAFRDTLEEAGLRPLVKTTGGKGLHVLVPLAPVHTYDAVRSFGEVIARHVHDTHPEKTTLFRMPAKRPRGTVYLDYVQIGMGKTMAAPFTVRARPQAPVSMPIEWAEVEEMASSRTRGTRAMQARYTIADVPALLEREGNPWSGNTWKEQRL